VGVIPNIRISLYGSRLENSCCIRCERTWPSYSLRCAICLQHIEAYMTATRRQNTHTAHGCILEESRTNACRSTRRHLRRRRYATSHCSTSGSIRRFIGSTGQANSITGQKLVLSALRDLMYSCIRRPTDYLCRRGIVMPVVCY